MRLFCILWVITVFNERAVDFDWGFTEPTIKGCRSKAFTASLAVVPICFGSFQRAKMLRFLEFLENGIFTPFLDMRTFLLDMLFISWVASLKLMLGSNKRGGIQMKRKRGILFCCSFLVLGLLLGTSCLHAETYPGRPIQVVVTGASGDATDVAGRLLAEELGKILKTPIVVLNKVGGGSSVGTDFVAKSRKDGYTLLYTNTSGVVYNPAFSPETTPYDTLRDLEPLAQHVSFPTGLWVKADSPWKNLAEVIDYSKKNPGKFRCSMLGLGSIVHFKLEIIKSLTGADIAMIPFKGAMPALTALLGGHLESCLTAVSITHPHYESGKVRGILLDQPLPELPGVPTLEQLGYKRGLPLNFNALFAPAGISQEVKDVLNPAVEKAAKNPELMDKLRKLWFIPTYKPAEELKQVIAQDYGDAREVVKRMGLKK